PHAVAAVEYERPARGDDRRRPPLDRGTPQRNARKARTEVPGSETGAPAGESLRSGHSRRISEAPGSVVTNSLPMRRAGVVKPDGAPPARRRSAIATAAAC